MKSDFRCYSLCLVLKGQGDHLSPSQAGDPLGLWCGPVQGAHRACTPAPGLSAARGGGAAKALDLLTPGPTAPCLQSRGLLGRKGSALGAARHAADLVTPQGNETLPLYCLQNTQQERKAKPASRMAPPTAQPALEGHTVGARAASAPALSALQSLGEPRAEKEDSQTKVSTNHTHLIR